MKNQDKTLKVTCIMLPKKIKNSWLNQEKYHRQLLKFKIDFKRWICKWNQFLQKNARKIYNTLRNVNTYLFPNKLLKSKISSKNASNSFTNKKVRGNTFTFMTNQNMDIQNLSNQKLFKFVKATIDGSWQSKWTSVDGIRK